MKSKFAAKGMLVMSALVMGLSGLLHAFPGASFGTHSFVGKDSGDKFTLTVPPNGGDIRITGPNFDHTGPAAGMPYCGPSPTFCNGGDAWIYKVEAIGPAGVKIEKFIAFCKEDPNTWYTTNRATFSDGTSKYFDGEYLD